MSCNVCNEKESKLPIELIKNNFETIISLTKNHDGIHTLDFNINEPFDYLSVVVIKFCPWCGKEL